MKNAFIYLFFFRPNNLKSLNFIGTLESPIKTWPKEIEKRLSCEKEEVVINNNIKKVKSFVFKIIMILL